MPFKKIGLCDELVQGILATGYTAPTEIQAEAIPIVIAVQMQARFALPDNETQVQQGTTRF